MVADLLPLKYDTKDEQYVYTWKTDRRWAGTCRRLFVALLDGSVRVADFSLR